jgi:hypothetical protein
MPSDELAQLELLSELDALLAGLEQWGQGAPDWQPAQSCKALVCRLQQRVETIRVRWEAPLVVAALGGTGTGKSALLNALLGEEAVATGRRRPTTIRPALICRPDITAEMLGIDPAGVDLVHRDLPVLRELVLVDCPDPDTTEELSPETLGGETTGNLARLRKILPHCDVLLVTTTQQKYRSARVAEELAAAAAGARLVFVQTHADTDDDIREDWRAALADQYAAGRLFFIDSLSALAEAQAGRLARGELAKLIDLLLSELVGAARNRIRRANFLDLLAETLARCRKLLEAAEPQVEQLQNALEAERGIIAATLARQMRAELLASRRPWENRLLSQVASRWGFSPFALVLRIYQGLGNWALGALLFRSRTPAQIALWGALEGVYALRKRQQVKQAEQGLQHAAGACWDQAEISKAALILDGYAAEAGVDRRAVSPPTIAAEAQTAGEQFVARASADLDALIARLAARHSGWFTRAFYELILGAMLGWLLFRLGKNFFYDSWLQPNLYPVYGLGFYLTAGFWLIVWCLLLLAALTGRLRRGLRREIDQLAEVWQSPSAAGGLFAHLESQCRRARQFRGDLDRLDNQVRQLQRQLALPDQKIGHLASAGR